MNRKTKAKSAFTLIELVVVVAILTLLFTLLLPARASTRANVARITCVNNLKQVGLAFRTWADAHQARFPMKVADSQGGAAGAVPVAGATAPNVWRIFQVLSNECKTPKVVVCPADERNPRTNFLNVTVGTTYRDFFDNTAVSYFVGADADDTRPQMFLSGDRNIGTGPFNPSSYGYSPSTVLGAAVSIGTNTSTGTGANLQWTDKMHQKQGNVLLADGSVQQLDSSRLRDELRRTGDSSAAKYTVISLGGNNILLP
ncbi:MAG TPA: prepilin-type N-terminal cleavage/methylation domain-containing protein [Verrucomicrobiae bacterium]